MEIKYKKSVSPGWVWQIDELDNKIEFNEKNKPERWAAMLKWIAEGNEIEPLFNAEELAAKELKDNEQALESQNQTLINYLDLSEKHVSNDPPYPLNVSEWKIARNEWRTQLKANELTEIYKKPY